MAVNGGGEKYPGIDIGPAGFRAAQRCGCDSSCRRPLWLGRRPTGGRINGGGDRLVVACQSKGGGGATRPGGLRSRPWRVAPASLLARLGQRGGAGPGGPGRARGVGLAREVAAWSRPKEEEWWGGKEGKERKTKREKGRKENEK
jgi:hypothetical protein